MSFKEEFVDLICSVASADSQLKLSEYYGDLNNAFDMEIYDARGLENRLAELIRPLVEERIKKNTKRNKVRNLHIISSPYVTGGHTRLCERLAKMESNVPDVMVSRAGENDMDAIKRLVTYFEYSIVISAKGSMVDRVVKIIEGLQGYKNIVLHIHPNDICVVIAINILKRVKELDVYFVNHADHCFSYGESIIDIKLYLSYRGYLVNKLRGPCSYKESFIGIPIDLPTKKLNFKECCTSYIMAGSSYKMKPSRFGSSPKIVEYVLRGNKKSTFTVIGPNLVANIWWWKVKLMYWQRLTIYEELPYDRYLDVVQSADACVDSSPLIGGTAFVELALTGLRPYGVHSGIGGYSPLDIIKSKTLDGMFDQRPSTDLLQKIEEIHAVDNVKRRYLNAFSGRYTDIPKYMTSDINDMALFRCREKYMFSLLYFWFLFMLDWRSRKKLFLIGLKYYSKRSFFVLFFTQFLSVFSKPIF